MAKAHFNIDRFPAFSPGLVSGNYNDLCCFRIKLLKWKYQVSNKNVNLF